MDSFKHAIQRQLAANIIKDKCAQNSNILFRDAWCTQERVIRFTTPFFRELFHTEEKETREWNTGDLVMFEAHNNTNSFTINCVYSPKGATNEQIKTGNKLIIFLKAKKEGNQYILNNWDISTNNGDINSLFQSFDSFLDETIPVFEEQIKGGMSHPDEDELKEGSVEYTAHRSYERNAKARAACIAAHGTVCAVCGMDFSKVYGPDFAGKIEVHHIVPISQIGKEYTVDPVNDLIPVCPNCHTALHSKKGGVYTIEELKKMRDQQL